MWKKSASDRNYLEDCDFVVYGSPENVWKVQKRGKGDQVKNQVVWLRPVLACGWPFFGCDLQNKKLCILLLSDHSSAFNVLNASGNSVGRLSVQTTG